jgi:hypothetical protein
MPATIADTHGLRVTATWLGVDDLFPTYHGLHLKHTTGTGTPNYAGLVADYTDYDDMLANAGASGIEVTEDLSCDVSGLRIRRGRDSTGEPVRAGTLSMTLNDWTGEHDPRVPPAGPSRTGANILVEVQPELDGDWVPVFSGFVESWRRNINAGDGLFSEVEVDATDAFSVLARAVAIPPSLGPVGDGENGAQRVDRLLDAATWVPKWGGRNIMGGLVAMNPTIHEGPILDEIHDVVMSEDGIFYATAAGTIYFYDRYWRGTRQLQAAALDITGQGLADSLPGVPWMCPSRYVATDDDLDMVNRAVVWRSTEFDGEPPPDPVKKYAHDFMSISQHSTLAHEYKDLPHASDTRSQELADNFVRRLGGATNNIGEFEVPMIKEPEQAAIAVGLEWGDQIIVWDDTGSFGTAHEFPFEFVGIEHDITPDDWTATLRVDRWIDEYLIPTGVIADDPGFFTPLGATVPEDLPFLVGLGALGETTAWTTGQSVVLGDESDAYWNGSAWTNGVTP